LSPPPVAYQRLTTRSFNVAFRTEIDAHQAQSELQHFDPGSHSILAAMKHRLVLCALLTTICSSSWAAETVNLDFRQAYEDQPSSGKPDSLAYFNTANAIFTDTGKLQRFDVLTNGGIVPNTDSYGVNIGSGRSSINDDYGTFSITFNQPVSDFNIEFTAAHKLTYDTQLASVPGLGKKLSGGDPGPVFEPVQWIVDESPWRVYSNMYNTSGTALHPDYLRLPESTSAGGGVFDDKIEYHANAADSDSFLGRIDFFYQGGLVTVATTSRFEGGFNLSEYLSNIVITKLDYTLTGQPAPIPEPETYALLIAGLGVISWMRRQSRTAAPRHPFQPA